MTILAQHEPRANLCSRSPFSEGARSGTRAHGYRPPVWPLQVHLSTIYHVRFARASSGGGGCGSSLAANIRDGTRQGRLVNELNWYTHNPPIIPHLIGLIDACCRYFQNLLVSSYTFCTVTSSCWPDLNLSRPLTDLQFQYKFGSSLVGISHQVLIHNDLEYRFS